MTAQPRHASSSDEHQQAERDIKALLASALNVQWFAQPPDALSRLQLDAYSDGDLPTLVEVFAHVGPCKAGQRRKISRDMTKLLLAERWLGRACRKVIAVPTEAEKAHVLRGWDAEFARAFDIEVIAVDAPAPLLERLAAAQLRQTR